MNRRLPTLTAASLVPMAVIPVALSGPRFGAAPGRSARSSGVTPGAPGDERAIDTRAFGAAESMSATPAPIAEGQQGGATT